MGQPSSSTPLPCRDFVKLTLAFLGISYGSGNRLAGDRLLGFSRRANPYKRRLDSARTPES